MKAFLYLYTEDEIKLYVINISKSTFCYKDNIALIMLKNGFQGIRKNISNQNKQFII